MSHQSSGFTGLRSGYCCQRYGVSGVPGYNVNGQWTANLNERGHKPKDVTCNHLRHPQIVNGRWISAACRLYESERYPDECTMFAVGDGDCAIPCRVVLSTI